MSDYDIAYLSLYGVFFVCLGMVVAFALYISRHDRPRHPAAGE